MVAKLTDVAGGFRFCHHNLFTVMSGDEFPNKGVAI